MLSKATSKIVLLIIILVVSLASVLHSQPTEGYFAIKNVRTGQLLRPEDADKADLIPIVLYSPNNWKCLTWEFIAEGSMSYQLRNLFTLKTFKDEVNSDKGTIELRQTAFKEDDINLIWVFVPVSEGMYRIKNNSSDLYLTPADSSGRINTPVLLQPKINSNLQFWTLYEQDPKF